MTVKIRNTRYKIDFETKKLYDEHGEEVSKKIALTPLGEYKEGLHKAEKDILIDETARVITELCDNETKDFIKDGELIGKRYVYLNDKGKAVGVMAVDGEVVTGITVVKEERRKGYGTQMLLDWKNKQGKDHIKVNGVLSNAEEFYRKIPIDVYKMRGEVEIL